MHIQDSVTDFVSICLLWSAVCVGDGIYVNSKQEAKRRNKIAA